MHCKEEFPADYALREFLLLFGMLVRSSCIKTRHRALVDSQSDSLTISG